MERDIELRLKGHLYEIRSVNDEVLESRQGYPVAEGGYRKTLESAVDVAEPELMDEMAAFIKEYIPGEERVRIGMIRRRESIRP